MRELALSGVDAADEDRADEVDQLVPGELVTRAEQVGEQVVPRTSRSTSRPSSSNTWRNA